MKTVIKKLFCDFTKEEEWINKKAQEGMALIDYSWGKYTFEDSKKGEYIYRLELLKEDPSEEGSREYIKFAEESGIECVAFHKKWAFFRRPSEDGPFEIFSDTESKINHLKGARSFYGLLFVLEFFFSMYIFRSGFDLTNDFIDTLICLVGGVFLFGVACVVGGIFAKMHRRIKELEKEKNLYE